MTKYVEIYLRKMKKIQYELLNVLNTAKDNELLYHELILFLNQYNISNNRCYLKSLLHLLAKIYETRHQQPDQIQIIENIILYYKNSVLNNFQNSEIFTIFKKDKKILLFLLKSEILKIDKFVITKFKKDEYSTYFFPEVNEFLEKGKRDEISTKIPDDFIEKRQIGENDSYICELIRNDSIDDFISYISKTNISLKSQINNSIFETNTFLIDKKPTLIEYSAFFGSIQIFQYLLLNNVELTESLWLYAIHGQNTEMISILEENQINPSTIKLAVNYFNESIQCHQNEIANYIFENYIEKKLRISKSVYFKSYNFQYIKTCYINQLHFLDFCRYDYPIFVNYLIKNMSIEKLNATVFQDEKYNRKVYSIEKSALSIAIENDNNEIAQILLSNDNIDINHIYNTYISVPYNDFDLFVVLLNITLISFILSLFVKYFITITICFIALDIAFIFDEIHIKLPASIRLLSNISTISSKSMKFLLGEFAIIHQAVANHNVEIVEILSSKQNIDINAVYKNMTIYNEESTALNIAVKNDDDEIVKILLKNPNIDVNIKFKNQNFKSMNNELVIISCMLMICSSKLLIILMILFLICLIQFIVTNRNAVLKYLLISTLSSILMYFTLKCLLPFYMFNFLLSICYNIYRLIVSIPYLYLLNVIEKVTFVYIIIELASTLLYTTYAIKTPLHIAVENNNVEIVKLLLTNENIDVNSIFRSCCYKYKCKYNSKYSFNLYEEVYASKTALNIAANQNNIDIVNLLLMNKNIDVTSKCKSKSFEKIIILNNTSELLYIIESIICLLFQSHSEK